MFTNMIRMIALMVLFGLAAQSISAQNTESNDEMFFALQGQRPEKTSNELLNKIVELNFSNQSVENALSEIAEQLDLKLMYTKELLPKSTNVSIKSKRMTLYDALWQVLEGTGLQFAISSNRQLVIVKRPDGNQISVNTVVQQTITGTVTDSETGEALPGVNVVVQRPGDVSSSPIGTTTDMNGQYELEVPDDVNTLIFSYVGYQRLEEPINGRSEINIELSQDRQLLDDVVVVGYGTQEKKEITSSISSVSSDEFNSGNINDPAELIQGKVAGLTISRPGGNPNEDFNIRLRGLSTIGANAEPLIVIDGVPGASLKNVDPNDIASIDVLKDGSAAAIYGTRASSGVLLITTKKGEAGGFQIDYSGSLTADLIENEVPVLSAKEYRNIGLEQARDYGSSTDWLDEITRTGLSQQHNLALSGGAGQTTYRISLNHRDVKGIQRKAGFSQLNGRVNITQKAIYDRLTLTGILSTTTRNSDLGFNEAFRYAAVYNPTQPVRSNDEAFNQYDGYFQESKFDYFNPVAIIEQNKNESKIKRLNTSLKADFNLLDQITLGAFYSQQNESELYGTYYDKNSLYIGAGRNGLASRTTVDRFSQLFDATVNYFDTFAQDLTVQALAGYSYQEFIDEGFNAQGGDFISDGFSYNNLSSALDFANGLGTVDSFMDEYRLIGFFGRVNLNFRDTYFLSSNIRRESSSRFGENYKWGTFPSISGGVDLGNLFDIPKVNTLKLRASYGVTGSNAPESNLHILRFGPQAGTFFFSDGRYIPSFGPVSNSNPNLKWEVKTEFDIGLDFNLLQNGRLSGSFDYYNRITKDLLLEFPVPVPPNLYDQMWVNIGELENTGLELAINYQALRGQNVNWNTSVTFSTFNTELVSLSNKQFNFGESRLLSNLGAPGLNGTPVIKVEEGAPIGQIWGPEFEKIDENGEWVLKDLNDDGIINDQDEKVIGNGLPDFEIGWSNSFNIKNFDFMMSFRGVFGHDLVNTNRAFYEIPSQISTYNILKSARDFINLEQAQQFSDLYVEDASYVRLNNLSIGYNFNISDDIPVSRLRLFANGKNLFTITGYSGVDPSVRFEDSQASLGPLSPGIDRRNTWVSVRSVTLGFNVEF